MKKSSREKNPQKEIESSEKLLNKQEQEQQVSVVVLPTEAKPQEKMQQQREKPKRERKPLLIVNPATKEAINLDKLIVQDH